MSKKFTFFEAYKNSSKKKKKPLILFFHSTDKPYMGQGFNKQKYSHRFHYFETIKSGLKYCFCLSFMFLFFGCGAKGFDLQINTNSSERPSEQTIPSEQVPPSGSGQTDPTPPSRPLPPEEVYEPLLWDTKRKEGASWTKFTLDLIKNDLAADFLQGTQDIEDFCPKYFQLTANEQVHFWGLLISAMTKYESNFNPLSRMQETTMGTDSVTGQPVYSEGLLQLSYQDTKWAPYCDFDWNSDKNLPPADPNKTILNPFKNLDCGVRIFARQVRKTKLIGAPAGSNYWAVIIPNGKSTKITNIQNLTKQQKGCL